MSDTDERTHCVLCGHPTDTDTHPKDEKGLQPCRSVNHPKGLNCTACERLISEPVLAAMQERRGVANSDRDSPEARAWAAFNAVREWAKYEFGESWPAFYTAIHQSALIAALTEYDKVREAVDAG